MNLLRQMTALLKSPLLAANTALGGMATQEASAVAITGGTITGMSSPSASSDVATKSYVDGLTDTGTSSGTLAAGDDSRITGAAQKASNLSDLASASTARTNLGLGTIATQAASAVAVTGGTVAGITQLNVNGQIKIKRTTVADQAYTALTTDDLIAYTSLSAGRTVTLPTASSAGAGFVYVIKDEAGAAATHNITIDGSGAETIDGSATAIINANYGGACLYCTGTAWFTVW